MRRQTELVVRFIVWLGNYDYVLDWIFDETGSLKGRVGATGIVQVKAVASQDMSAKSAPQDTAYGRLIAPGTVAVNHDHFFGFRLDLDVDGTKNGMLVDRLRKVDLKQSRSASPRKEIWQVFPHEAGVESEAKLNADSEHPALWRVINPDVRNGVGNPVSYQLKPGMHAMALLDDAELAQRRAAFTAYNLWVTPYRPDERYAAGPYPNRHPGGAGLPEWTASNRSIRDTDIVLWYTMGMHHVVRAEDWPIMPLVECEFELRPFDFFASNPTG
jgi:primary-amine oxidase